MQLLFQVLYAKGPDKIQSCLTDSRATFPLSKCESPTYMRVLIPLNRSRCSLPCALVHCFFFMADCLNSAAQTCVALLLERDRSQKTAKVTCHFDDFIWFDSHLFEGVAQSFSEIFLRGMLPQRSATNILLIHSFLYQRAVFHSGRPVWTEYTVSVMFLSAFHFMQIQSLDSLHSSYCNICNIFD